LLTRDTRKPVVHHHNVASTVNDAVVRNWFILGEKEYFHWVVQNSWNLQPLVNAVEDWY